MALAPYLLQCPWWKVAQNRPIEVVVLFVAGGILSLRFVRSLVSVPHARIEQGRNFLFNSGIGFSKTTTKTKIVYISEDPEDKNG